MIMNDGKQYHPHEFFPVLGKLTDTVVGEGHVVICGGQAVNLCAAVFLNEKQLRAILGKTSAMSDDMDIVITRELQNHICKPKLQPGFSINSFADFRQPIQFAVMPDDLPDTRIDVLRSIKGIHIEKDRIFEDALELDNSPFLVMNPTTLLIAKAENCATLEQDSPTSQRNDIKHLKLLIPIVHNYLQKLVQDCDPMSKAEQREIIRFLKNIHAASQKANFIKAMKLAQVELHDAIPIKEIRSSKLETLRNYLNRTFLAQPEGMD